MEAHARANQAVRVSRAILRITALSVTLVLLGQAGCSSGTPSNPSAGSSAAAGTESSAAGAVNSGGSSGASAPGGAGSGTGGDSGGSAGISAGGASGGGKAGGESSGSAGISAGGSTDAGGSPGNAGLGGTTNSLGTLSGSPAVAKLLALTSNCSATNKIASDTGLFQTDSGTTVHVCSLKGGTGNSGGAVYYTADMDIDCDGLTTTHCPGTGADKDPSYDDQTSFSGPNSKSNTKGPSLASENTPYVVIPEEVTFPGLDQNNGGNIVAVIYKDQIEFAVFGDQIQYQQGDPGEPIGEASVRTAVGLGIPSSPASGGVGSGVTYIAFAGPGSQPADMENISEIQTLGAKLLLSLLANNP
jgi:hypothetical protein